MVIRLRYGVRVFGDDWWVILDSICYVGSC